MNEKQLPNLDEFGFGGHRFTTEVYIWSSSVDQVGWERVLHPDFLRDVSSVTERPQALEEFAAALPPGARLVIVTDGSGKDSIENEIRSVVQNRVPEIAGHSVELILV